MSKLVTYHRGAPKDAMRVLYVRLTNYSVHKLHTMWQNRREHRWGEGKEGLNIKVEALLPPPPDSRKTEIIEERGRCDGKTVIS